MALQYLPDLLAQAGAVISVADPTDAAFPNKLAPLPAVTVVDQSGNAAGSGTAGSPTVTTTQPATTAGAAIVPATAVNVSSLVAKASPGNLYGASMTAGTTAGYLIAYNAVAAPAGGAALTANLILAAVPVAASGFASIGGTPVPDRFGVGITLLFSTSTTTYTVPANLALHMRAQAV